MYMCIDSYSTYHFAHGLGSLRYHGIRSQIVVFVDDGVSFCGAYALKCNHTFRLSVIWKRLLRLLHPAGISKISDKSDFLKKSD